MSQFKVGDELAIVTRSSRYVPPEKVKVTRVNQKFLEVEGDKGRLYLFQEDGSDRYPRSRERFRTYFERLEPWADKHAQERLNHFRRNYVESFSFKSLTDEQIEKVYEVLKKIASETPEALS